MTKPALSGPAAALAGTDGVLSNDGVVSNGTARIGIARTFGAGRVTNTFNAVHEAGTIDEPKWPDLPPDPDFGPRRSPIVGPRSYVAHFAHFAEPPRTEGPDRWNGLPF